MSSVELPIFPLPIVLFPGTPQLLHVFEPQYRQLLADCLEGDRTFGISFTAAEAGGARPAPGEVGCAAIVQGTRRLPDGRSNVLAMGGERYVLRDYVDRDRPYLTAVVETFDDFDEDAPGLDELAGRVRNGFLKFVLGMHTLADQTVEHPELSRDAKALSFQVAAGIDVDTQVKHGFLQLRSTKTRLEQLDRLLAHLNQEVERRAAVHVRARGNGRGDRAPDLAPDE